MSDGASLHIFRPNLSSKISSKSPLPKEANGSHKMPPFVKKEIAGGGGGGGGVAATTHTASRQCVSQRYDMMFHYLALFKEEDVRMRQRS